MRAGEGKPKVRDVRPALTIEQDIRRFQISVNDAMFVGMMHRIGNIGNKSGPFRG